MAHCFNGRVRMAKNARQNLRCYKKERPIHYMSSGGLFKTRFEAHVARRRKEYQLNFRVHEILAEPFRSSQDLGDVEDEGLFLR